MNWFLGLFTSLRNSMAMPASVRRISLKGERESRRTMNVYSRARLQTLLKTCISKILLKLDRTSCLKSSRLIILREVISQACFVCAQTTNWRDSEFQSRETFWARARARASAAAGRSSHVSEFRRNIWHPFKRP